MPDIFKNPKTSAAQASGAAEKPEAETTTNETAKTNQNPIRIFTTFLKDPTGISFAQQDPDEKIALFLRRDFATNTGWLASTIVLIIIPPLLGFIFQATNFSLPFFPTNFTGIFTLFYYFVVAGFAFSNFLTWFFTIGLITTKRAVDIDFVNVSSVRFASANLTDIIDAKYSQNGFSQSFFDYGDVDLIIQTPKEKLSFEKAPRPSEVADVIDNLTLNNHNA